MYHYSYLLAQFYPWPMVYNIWLPIQLSLLTVLEKCPFFGHFCHYCFLASFMAIVRHGCILLGTILHCTLFGWGDTIYDGQSSYPVMLFWKKPFCGLFVIIGYFWASLPWVTQDNVACHLPRGGSRILVAHAAKVSNSENLCCVSCMAIEKYIWDGL